MQRKTLEDKFAVLLSEFYEYAIRPHEMYPFQIIIAIRELMHSDWYNRLSYKERLNETIKKVESYLNESEGFFKKWSISDQEYNCIESLKNYNLKNKMQERIEEDKKEVKNLQSQPTAVSIEETVVIPVPNHIPNQFIQQPAQVPMWYDNSVIPQPPPYYPYHVPYEPTNPFVQQPAQPNFMYTNPFVPPPFPNQFSQSSHILFSHPAPQLQPQPTYAPEYYGYHQPPPGF